MVSVSGSAVSHDPSVFNSQITIEKTLAKRRQFRMSCKCQRLLAYHFQRQAKGSVTTGIADCCARAASGHAAAPPTNEMKLRPRICPRAERPNLPHHQAAETALC